MPLNGELIESVREFVAELGEHVQPIISAVVTNQRFARLCYHFYNQSKSHLKIVLGRASFINSNWL